MSDHICFIPPYAYPKIGFSHGGIGSFTKSFLPELVKRGYKVTLIEFNKQKISKNIDGVTIIYLKRANIRGLSWLFNACKLNAELTKLHKKHPISIIESAELGLAFIKKNRDIKYLIRLHGGHHFFAESENRNINIWKGFQEKLSFKKADAFIAVSNYVKKQTNTYLTYHHKPIEIIPSTINVNLFKPIKNIKVDENVILFAGRLCEKKGVKNLILAMPKILEKYPNACLHIYGKDSYKTNMSYKQFLLNDIMPKIGLAQNNVIFKGELPIEELAKKYASSKICVFPSYMETQGLVVIEAMAMKKGVVFSQYGPGTKVINHQVNGLLCNPYDITSIANEIIWMLDNPNLLRKIEENALETINISYNLEDITNKNLMFYSKLTAQ